MSSNTLLYFASKCEFLEQQTINIRELKVVDFFKGNLRKTFDNFFVLVDLSFFLVIRYKFHCLHSILFRYIERCCCKNVTNLFEITMQTKCSEIQFAK